MRLSQLPIFIKTYTQAQEKYQAAKNLLQQDQSETAEKEFEEAIALYETAIVQGRQALGENSLIFADYLYKLAHFFWKRGQYLKGIPYAREIDRKVYGEKYPKVAKDLSNLANLYYNQRKYEEAEPIYQQSLQIREKHFEVDHPLVAESLNNLGALYYQQDKYLEAQKLLSQSLKIRQKVLGIDHLDTQTTQNWLDKVQQAMSDESTSD